MQWCWVWKTRLWPGLLWWQIWSEFSALILKSLLVFFNLLCSFLPAVNNLTNEHLEAEKTHRRLERELKALRKKLADTLVLRSSLQELVSRETAKYTTKQTFLIFKTITIISNSGNTFLFKKFLFTHSLRENNIVSLSSTDFFLK